MTAPLGAEDLDARELAALEGLARVQARVAGGARRVDALLGEPEDLRADIEELLVVLDRVESVAEAPSREFAAALGTRLEASVEAAGVEARTQQRPRWLSLSLMRLAAVVGAVALALGVGGFAAVDAAEETIPGDVLYPVKEAGENVRLLFARGDGITRLRLAQLAHRQAELEQAVQRGAPPRVVLRLETKVALATTELVKSARRFDASGNGAPAEASLGAVTALHDRIDVLAAEEQRPEVERLLRRMALYLEGQERELEEIAREQPRGGVPLPEAPPVRATPTSSFREVAPVSTATRPAILATPVPAQATTEATARATPTATPTADPSRSLTSEPLRGTATATPPPVRPR